MKELNTTNAITDEAGTSGRCQTTLTNVVLLTAYQKRELDADLAMAMYLSNVPFNSVANAYWRRFFTKLNAAYVAAH
jgi:formylmethanofuran dehydrogenase subunit A